MRHEPHYTGMICRLWHGWTAAGDADAYERYLREELYPRLEGGPGFAGYDVLRRAGGDEVEFVTMTWFDSLDAVRAFAGNAYERPVITETAARLLARSDTRAVHYELAATTR
jgi:heme-degrading monooxygenase HmoA